MIPPYNIAVFKRNIDTFFLLYPPPPYLVNRLLLNVPATDMILPGTAPGRAFRALPRQAGSPKRNRRTVTVQRFLFGADTYSI